MIIPVETMDCVLIPLVLSGVTVISGEQDYFAKRQVKNDTIYLHWFDVVCCDVCGHIVVTLKYSHSRPKLTD